MNSEIGFLFLNDAGQWPSFQRHNLDVTQDGSLRLSTSGGAFEQAGVFLGGPFDVHADATAWYRLQVAADPLPVGTHLQVFTFTADGGTPPFAPASDNPFGDSGWRAAPRDALEAVVLNPPSRLLWVGGVVRGDGLSSPTVRQMKVVYGRETYLQFLPAIYREPDAQRDLLERTLSLFESVLGGLDATVSDLTRLFDAAAAPAGEAPAWLRWLAGWLAFPLDEHWTDGEARRFLAEAFELYGRRGTVQGLRRYLKMYAGVEAHVDEPGLTTTLWSLGASRLGFSTMLAPGNAQGAVVGTTATLDQSHLTRGGDRGAALFEDVAHRFCVRVYCGELTRPGALDDARAVIERERPAHTAYHLCAIEPRLRVGVQARVGIDAIVGQGAPAARVGRALDGVTLAATAEPCEAREDT